MVSNSCKKESQTELVSSLLTHGTWQLASVIRRNFIGNTEFDDTLNTTCTLKQLFQFTSNNTCTYTDYACISQPAAQGNWTLLSNGLNLTVNMDCIDTVKGTNGLKTTNAKPFIYTQIYNLGQYSLVLRTGDITTYVTATTKRIILEYGFVHPSAN